MVREANKPCGAAGEVVLSSSLRAKGEQSLWSCQPWSSSLVDPMGLQEHEPSQDHMLLSLLQVSPSALSPAGAFPWSVWCRCWQC